MVRQFSQDLMASRAASGASPMMGMAPTGVADLREAPGTGGLAQAASPTWQRGRVVG
jgi:hypothetical protein